VCDQAMRDTVSTQLEWFAPCRGLGLMRRLFPALSSTCRRAKNPVMLVHVRRAGSRPEQTGRLDYSVHTVPRREQAAACRTRVSCSQAWFKDFFPASCPGHSASHLGTSRPGMALLLSFSTTVLLAQDSARNMELQTCPPPRFLEGPLKISPRRPFA
jgi:hypothetical protein